MVKKIALEEHYSSPMNDAYWDKAAEANRDGKPYFDFVEKRLWNTDDYIPELQAMDISKAVMSLTSPGVQGIADTKKAIELAQSSNDAVYEKYVAQNPEQFTAFAAVALQDPAAAASELERAVNDLGMKGALINGYSNIGSEGETVYLDDPSMDVFWKKVNELDVPVYLHPRDPQPNQQRIYQDLPGLIGSVWGFTQETAVHVIRIMMSGLFDRYPNIKLIIGHLGEGLSQTLPRTQHRLYKQINGENGGDYKRPLTDYLRTNVYATTSGHFTTTAFNNALSVFGPDHILFSVDYPYEDNADAAVWFDQLPITDELKQKIGYDNAAKILRIDD
ncbi:putative amidohydrolase [Weissella oryzae SG25]|uniref:Putative amidohydrolase n=1 Tax=Weissella oryzae (strain DSM 25784 / JCM 18191 / LMG 30913 / SG25) TaxID=1329250 RepID=A0A069CS42_WEIOS|nr:amidohydrolase family protein [Weissella oryzae]GAK30239.1 putative amidohydrolase [Weissella oryzae SG25]